ncbi:MAG: bifunctional riboflavin kinase/FAD synthetase [Rhodothermales bacterium]|nr:bifunctional riboflavin kinase/FAD synthetase [Rhodothermales bacterium]
MQFNFLICSLKESSVEILRQISDVQKVYGAAVTVGTMDGVHIGHQAIVARLIDVARESKIPSVVITFHPHPREIVQGVPVPLLTTVEERAEILANEGVDNLFVLNFDKSIAEMTPESFVRQLLVQKFGVKHIVAGYDHGFGRDREGDADLLRRLGELYDFAVTEVDEMKSGSVSVSSSAARRHLESGDVQSAAEMLGRPYRISGLVVEGDKRGRTIGFPTANLRVPPEKLLPMNGVYRVDVDVGAESFVGMLNIGVRPTFDSTVKTVEVHLLDFTRDIYGAVLQVDFLQRLRPEKKFEDIDALKRQLSLDRDRCRGASRSATL